jgi:hypothetical protein
VTLVDVAAAPPWLSVGLCIALGWALAQATERYPALRTPVSAAVGLAGLAAVCLVLWQPALETYDDEARAQRVKMMIVAVAAVVGLAQAAMYALGGSSVRKLRALDRRLLVDAATVAAWSGFVRFALTTPNILTDGGTGYRRLQTYMSGMGGLSLLLDLLRGGPADAGDMWGSIWLPSMLAALAPVALLLLAYALRFDRRTSLLAGLMLASFPLHAAMFRSDFLVGSAVAISTLGLACEVHAVRTRRWGWLWPASLLIAFALLVRPEAPIIGVAVAAFGWPARRELLRPIVAIPAIWLAGVAAVASVFELRAAGTPGMRTSSDLLGLPFAAWLRDPRTLPPWLTLPLPLGAWALLKWGREHRHELVAIVVAVAAASVPVLRFGGDSDISRTFMEWPRYGTWLMPWAALISAVGSVWLCDRVVARVLRSTRAGAASYALLAAAVVATPLLSRDYLAVEYGHRLDEPVFRRALEAIPQGCSLIVPDDEGDEQAGGTVEIGRRYAEIAREAGRYPDLRIVGVVTARDLIESEGLPPGCWYLFEGAHCYFGYFDAPSAVCREVLSLVDAQPVLSEKIDYVHHRLIVRPDLAETLLRQPGMTLTLYRLAPRS